MSDFSELTDALIKGDEARVLELTQAAMDAGTPAGEILKTGLIVGMTSARHTRRSSVWLNPTRSLSFGPTRIIGIPADPS